ncbi:hypothetical protein D3C86_1462420 [compost metagenome]
MAGVEESLTQAEQLAKGWEKRLGAITQQCENAVQAFRDERTAEAQAALEEAREELASLGKRWVLDTAFLPPLAQGPGPMDPSGRRQAMQQAERLRRQTQEANETLRTLQAGLRREAGKIERALHGQSAAALASQLQAFSSATRQLVGLSSV